MRGGNVKANVGKIMHTRIADNGLAQERRSVSYYKLDKHSRGRLTVPEAFNCSREVDMLVKMRVFWVVWI